MALALTLALALALAQFINRRRRFLIAVSVFVGYASGPIDSQTFFNKIVKEKRTNTGRRESRE